MRRRGRVQDQAARVADVGEMREQLARLDHANARLVAAIDAEGEDRAGALGQVLLGQCVVRVGRQPGVRHPGDLGVRGEPFGDRLGVGAMALHAERQGLDALQQKIGVHRRQCRPEVAKCYGARLHGEAEVAEGLGEGQAVVARIGLGHGRKLAALPPVEAARFDDHAAHRVAVAADELGHRMDDDVGAPFEGPAEIRRRHGVVDDQRHAVAPGDLRDRLEVDDDAARVGQVLDEDRLAFRRHGALEILRIAGVDEMAGPAHALEGDAELGQRAAVEALGRDELVTRVQERREGEELSGVARGRGHRGAAVLEARDAFFEHRDRRVGHPRVDVAEGLQVEQRGGVVDVVEDVGRGLKNRRRACARGGVGSRAGVDRARLDAVITRRPVGRQCRVQRVVVLGHVRSPSGVSTR